MATYTNTVVESIKEPIYINSKDRITTQNVRLCHALNEYWGTFKGNVELSGGELSDVAFVDMTAKSGTLCGDVIFGNDKMDVKTAYWILHNLSDYYELDPKSLSVVVKDLSTDMPSVKISAIYAASSIQNLSAELSSKLQKSEFKTSCISNDAGLLSAEDFNFKYEAALSALCLSVGSKVLSVEVSSFLVPTAEDVEENDVLEDANVAEDQEPTPQPTLAASTFSEAKVVDDRITRLNCDDKMISTTAAQVITSLKQNFGQLSYSAKVLECSDIQGFQTSVAETATTILEPYEIEKAQSAEEAVSKFNQLLDILHEKFGLRVIG